MSCSPLLGTWVSTEVPARSGLLCRRAEPLGCMSRGCRLDSAPIPLQPGADPTALTPKAVPPALLHPPVPPPCPTPAPSTSHPTTGCRGSSAARGQQHSHSRVCVCEEQPLFPAGSAGEGRTCQGAGPWRDPASCTVHGSVEQAKGLLVTKVTSHWSVVRRSMGTWSPRGMEQVGGWGTATCLTRNAGSPRCITKGPSLPKPSPGARASTPPRLCVRSEQKPSFCCL